ncbi:MAG: hypothetical protein O3A40_05710 [Bacteroidetes bacterium]|nr:hypothetical protein [Bacteroidota bacterium]
MKKITFIFASALLCTTAMVSCTSNKMAVNSFEDNLYFMSADVKKATENAVANNQPATFQNLTNSSVIPQENFSSKNVNPEYLSRYGQQNTSSGEDVVYFEENESSSNTSTPNIDIYNSFQVSNFNSGWGNSGWGNSAFNFGFSPFGMGMMGMNPFGMGMYDPFWGPGLGWRPGFNVGLSLGWGRPYYNPFNPYMGYGGFYDPFWGSSAWGSSWGAWGRPIYATGPIIILPGSENGGRSVVYGARPSRGSSMSNGAGGVAQNIGIPNTARAQARENVANATNTSPRRLDSPESPRSATRDFSNSQNDYYSSGRSRVESNTRNVNSAASGRSTMVPTRNSAQSARPYTAPSSTGRGYNSSPNSRSYGTGTSRSTSSSPSYNRSTGSSNRANWSSSSYGRTESNSYNSGSAPSRSSSNSSYSSPSRSSYGGSYDAPSRSSSGSSSSSRGSRGRGN